MTVANTGRQAAKTTSLSGFPRTARAKSCLLTVLSLLVAGVAAAARIRGTVRGHDGKPLPDIAVLFLGEHDAATGRREILGRDTTCRRGRFNAPAATGRQPELIRLEGPAGAGHLRYDRPSWRRHRLVYPVRTTIVLLHDNDLHFNFNEEEQFAENLAALRQRYRHVFLVNAGDIFRRLGNYRSRPLISFYARHSRRMVELMNRYGYDAMTLGNHELEPVDTLTLEALATAQFPLLAANIDDDSGLLPEFQPYAVLHTDTGITLALLGLSVINFEQEGITQRDPIATAAAYRRLAADHDLLIGLTHIGHYDDIRLAQAMPEFAVIIGGHSHTLFDPAIDTNGVLIAQAGGVGGRPGYLPVDPRWPRQVGKVVLELENDRLTKRHGRVATFSAAGPLQMALTLDRDNENRVKTDRHGRLTGSLSMVNTAFINVRAGTEIRVAGRRVFRRTVAIPRGEQIFIPFAVAPRQLRDAVPATVTAGAAVAGHTVPSEKKLTAIILPRIEPVTVDGDLSEWTTAQRVTFTPDTLRLHPHSPAGTAPPADYHAELLLGWDGANLCVAVRVADSVHRNDQTGDAIWNGDALQFAVAPREPRREHGFDSHDILAGLALTADGVVFRRWRGPRFSGHKYAVQRDEERGETRYEFTVPLTALGVSAGHGGAMAFNLVIINDDSGNGMESWYELSPGILFGHNPRAFPTLILLDDTQTD